MGDFYRTRLLPPYVFDMTAKLKQQAMAKGIDIIDLSMGNPDGATPTPIVDDLIESAKQPEAHRYSVSRGIAPLRIAMSHWYEARFNVLLDPMSETIVTMGAKEGLAHLALAITQPGEVVLAPDPCYPIHAYGFVLAGANLVSISLSSPHQFLKELTEYLINNPIKPAILVINFPSNPTTQCVDIAFFEEIVALAKQFKFWVIHDFAYADICFDGYQPPSILQVAGAKEVAVEVFSLSKSYNMAGWRIGFVSGNKTLVNALAHIKSYLDYGLFAPIQDAAVKALESPQSMVKGICNTYQARRDILCDGLTALGWETIKPKATMFVWAEIPDAYKKLGSLAFSALILKEAQLSVSPGIGFGKEGDLHVRFALIQNEMRTQEALRRLAHFFEQGESTYERELKRG